MVHHGNQVNAQFSLRDNYLKTGKTKLLNKYIIEVGLNKRIQNIFFFFYIDRFMIVVQLCKRKTNIKNFI